MDQIKQRNPLGVFIYASVGLIHGVLGFFWMIVGLTIILEISNPFQAGFSTPSWPLHIAFLLIVLSHGFSALLCRKIVSNDDDQHWNYFTAAALLTSGAALTFCNSHYVVLNLMSMVISVPLMMPMTSEWLRILRPYNYFIVRSQEDFQLAMKRKVADLHVETAQHRNHHQLIRRSMGPNTDGNNQMVTSP